MYDCPLCDRPIEWSGDPYFDVEGGLRDEDGSFERYADALIHWNCYASWPDRTRFAKAWVDFWVSEDRCNADWGGAHLDGDVYVSVNPHYPVEQATVRTYITGYPHTVALTKWSASNHGGMEWKTWIAGGWEAEPDLHPVEQSTLAEVVPRLAALFPTEDMLIQAVDWSSKGPPRQTGEEERREFVAGREAKHAAAVAEGRGTFRNSSEFPVLACLYCGIRSTEYRFVESVFRSVKTLKGVRDAPRALVCCACGSDVIPERPKYASTGEELRDSVAYFERVGEKWHVRTMLPAIVRRLDAPDDSIRPTVTYEITTIAYQRIREGDRFGVGGPEFVSVVQVIDVEPARGEYLCLCKLLDRP